MNYRHLPYRIDPTRNRFEFYENFWKQKALELLLKHYAPKGKTALDYGCGRGEAIGLFNRAGFAASGTDADPECVKIASQFGPTSQLNLADPLGQFGEKSFDVVACFHVLEHVDNPKAVLNALRAIARDYVVLAVPNLRSLARLFARGIERDWVNEGHLQGWDHWHFLNLAEKHCGLQLVEWGFDATILPVFNRFCEPWFGMKFTVWLESGPFIRLLPYHCNSVMGLFRPT